MKKILLIVFVLLLFPVIPATQALGPFQYVYSLSCEINESLYQNNSMICFNKICYEYEVSYIIYKREGDYIEGYVFLDKNEDGVYPYYPGSRMYHNERLIISLNNYYKGINAPQASKNRIGYSVQHKEGLTGGLLAFYDYLCIQDLGGLKPVFDIKVNEVLEEGAPPFQIESYSEDREAELVEDKKTRCRYRDPLEEWEIVGDWLIITQDYDASCPKDDYYWVIGVAAVLVIVLFFILRGRR